MNSLSHRLALLWTKNPKGQVFEALPWDDLNTLQRERLPIYLRISLNPGKVLGGCAALALFVALCVSSQGSAALSAGVIAAMIASYLRAWRQSGAWELSNFSCKARVHEHERFEIGVTVSNSGKSAMETLVLRFCFEGSLNREVFALVPSLQPKERRRIKVQFKADRGMGHHKLSDLKVVVRDPMGFFFFCLSHPIDRSIEVLPEDIPLGKVDVEVAGLTSHSGVFELKASGDSTSFLGLREWQLGDSIRHIDWKRSQRQGELLVKTFERMCATDATILFDQRADAHCEFGPFSSLESLRDSAISFAKQLLHQQLRMQFISMTHTVPLGVGRGQEQLLAQTIMQQQLVPGRSFTDLLHASLPQIPPESMVILMFCAARMQAKDLWESLLILDDRRVDTRLVVIDTKAYEREITAAANLSWDQLQALDFFRSSPAEASNASSLDKLMRKLMYQTYTLGPKQKVSDVMNFGLRR